MTALLVKVWLIGVLSSQVRQIFFCLQHIICCHIQKHIMLSHRSCQFHTSVLTWLYITARRYKTTNYLHWYVYIACQNIDLVPCASCGWSSNLSKLNPIEQIWCELNFHVWCRPLKYYHSDKPCRSGTTSLMSQSCSSWCQWDVIYNLSIIPMVDTRVIDFLLTFFGLGLCISDFVILAFVLLHCLMALCQHMFWLNVKYLLFWYFWYIKYIIDTKKNVCLLSCVLYEKKSLYSVGHQFPQYRQNNRLSFVLPFLFSLIRSSIYTSNFLHIYRYRF